MRGRIVLFVILAIVTALVSVWLGWPTTTPKAIGEPATTTQADSPVGPTQRRGSGSGPSRSPTASSPKAGPPRTGANLAGNATQPGQPPATKPASPPPPSTDPVRLGKVTTTPSNSDTSIQDEGRALTTAFEDRVVEGGPGATEPATRSFAMALPLTDGAKGETLRVYVQGYAFVQESGGAYARLTLKLNGQGTVRYYRSGWDDSFIEVLEVPAIPATTYRLSGVLEVHQNPGSDVEAYLNVITVDIEIS
jgi:hypothetical protein